MASDRGPLLVRHEQCRRRLLVAAAVASCTAGWSARAADQSSVAAGGRSALIVGNSRYPAALLKNPVNDARLMQTVLRELGFGTTVMLDAGLPHLLSAVSAWLGTTSAASTRFFYFAGHGAQYRGRNYLIPVDAELRSEDDLPGRTVDASELIARLSRLATGVNLVVLDACRAVPMLQPPPGTRQRGNEARRPAPGLSPMPAPRGTLVGYATAPGALAADEPAQGNSPYTRHLAAALRVPGLSIESVFKQTRTAVLQESGGTPGAMGVKQFGRRCLLERRRQWIRLHGEALSSTGIHLSEREAGQPESTHRPSLIRMKGAQ